MKIANQPEVIACRGCGCDDDHACVTREGPCAWVLLDIDMPTGVCSACAIRVGWDMREMATMGFGQGADEEAA
jgi:hypothetical protein